MPVIITRFYHFVLNLNTPVIIFMLIGSMFLEKPLSEFNLINKLSYLESCYSFIRN